MSRLERIYKILLSGFVALMLVGGVTVVASSQDRPVVVAQGVDASTLDPNVFAFLPQVSISRHMFDSLVEFTDDMKLVPGLAKSWENPDPKTYVFHLRRGVKFHDGVEFTAKDVKFTFERMQDPKYKTDFKKNVEGAKVTVIDDYTVKVELPVPNAVFLPMLERVMIVPKHVIEKVGTDEFSRNPVGTGPFKFVEWVKDERVVLKANPDYYKGAPKIKTVVFRPIPEASTRFAALLSGEVDVIVNVTPDLAKVLEKNKNARVERVTSLRTVFIAMNCHEPPFNDVRVRQAMNYAVDVQSIIDSLLGGTATRANGPVPPAVFGYNPDVKPYPYDPKKAKQLLAEAGYPNGFETTLESPNGRYLMDKEVAQAIAGQLAQVGVKAKVNVSEWGVYYSEKFLGKKMKGMFLFGMGNPIVDADHAFSVQLDSTRRGLYYHNPRINEIAKIALQTVNPEERLKLYHEAMRIVHDDAPWIFLYDLQDLYGVSNRLNWHPRADEQILLYRASVK